MTMTLNEMIAKLNEILKDHPEAGDNEILQLGDSADLDPFEVEIGIHEIEAEDAEEASCTPGMYCVFHTA